MAKAKKGDYLSCAECGLVVVVDEECGCAEAEIMCCDEPMARGKMAAAKAKKVAAAKKPAAKAVKAPAKAAAKAAPVKVAPKPAAAKAPAKAAAKKPAPAKK